MISYTPPTYKISQNTIGHYQIDVQIESMYEGIFDKEAEKSSLFAVALIQKLGANGDKQALNLRSLYQGYRHFMENGNSQIYISKCNEILQNQPDILSKNCANYVLSLLNNQTIETDEHANLLMSHLIPHLKETMALKRPEMLYMPQEVTLTEINAKHLAFPDLIKYKDEYYICFREANSHVTYQDFGQIRILKGTFNKENNKWSFEKAGLLSKEGIDLRDPRFFIDHENVLQIIMGGSTINENDETASMTPYVGKFINNEWEILKANADPLADGPKGQWIWRVTWNPKDNHGYGLSYGKNETLSLMKTSDGLNYKKIAEIAHDQLTELTEATIRFKSDGEAVAFIRTRRNGIIAHSSHDSGYSKWTCSTVPFRVGGQDFLFSKNEEKMWAATRHYFLNEDNSLDESTIIALMNKESVIPAFRMKSQFDNSYPSMVLEDDGSATVIYYSSDENDVSRIYITRITLPD